MRVLRPENVSTLDTSSILLERILKFFYQNQHSKKIAATRKLADRSILTFSGQHNV